MQFRSRKSIYLSIYLFIYFFEKTLWFFFMDKVRLTAWKVSNHGVFSGPNTGKYGTEKTPYLDTFHAVYYYSTQDKKWKYRKAWLPNIHSVFRHFAGVSDFYQICLYTQHELWLHLRVSSSCWVNLRYSLGFLCSLKPSESYTASTRLCIYWIQWIYVFNMSLVKSCRISLIAKVLLVHFWE